MLSYQKLNFLKKRVFSYIFMQKLKCSIFQIICPQAMEYEALWKTKNLKQSRIKEKMIKENHNLKNLQKEKS